jgi:hypothetical protein
MSGVVEVILHDRELPQQVIPPLFFRRCWNVLNLLEA